MKIRSSSTTRLTKRLSAYAVSSGALLLITGNLNSQVVYSGPQNLQIGTPKDSLNLDLDGDSFDDFRFMILSSAHSSSFASISFLNKYSLAYAGLLNVRTDVYNSWRVRSESMSVYYDYSSQRLIAAGLEMGSPIAGNNSGWVQDSLVYWPGILGIEINKTVNTFYTSYTLQLDEGDFNDRENFLGVRFHIGDDLHYGWIRLMTNADMNTLTLVDWAYESTPERSILTGDGLGLDLPPWIVISGNEDSNIDHTTITLTATEELSGFTFEDIQITNGVGSEFIEISPNLGYSFVLTAFAEREVLIEIPAGSCTDNAANDNPVVTASWNYDITIPKIKITIFRDSLSNSPTVDGVIRFSEPVTTLSSQDLTIINGSLPTLEFDPYRNRYIFTMVTILEGEASLQVDAAAVSDMAGNLNAVEGVSWSYDITPAKVQFEVFAEETTDAEMKVDISFSEVISGLLISDFEINNGTAISLSTVSEGRDYTLNVRANDPGIVVVRLREERVSDEAGNLCNSTLIGWYYNPMATDSKLSQEVHIYPNPANDLIQIRSARPVNISILDIQGRLIMDEKGIQNSGIDISGLEQGIYLIRVQDGEEYFYQKLVKE